MKTAKNQQIIIQKNFNIIMRNKPLQTTLSPKIKSVMSSYTRRANGYSNVLMININTGYTLLPVDAAIAGLRDEFNAIYVIQARKAAKNSPKIKCRK